MRRLLSIPVLVLMVLIALPVAALAASTSKTTLPVIQFKFTGATVNENGGQASIAFTRTGNTAQLNQVSSVLFTTNGGSATGGSSCANVPAPDYVTAANRVITFPAGSTLQTTPVLICNQLTYDGNETVNTIITSPTNAQLNFQKNTSVISITETNARASISVGAASGPEGSILSFPVTLTGATALPVTVTYTTSGGTAVAGTDYTYKTGTLTWGPQTTPPTTQNVTVQTLDNGVENGNLTFNLVLSASINGSLANTSAVGTITNVDGAPSASPDSPAAWEGSLLVFTVTLSHASAFPITVGYTTADFGAVGGAFCGLGADYLPAAAILTFPAGTTSLPVNVTTCAAGSTEFDRLVRLVLGPTTDASLATVTTSNNLGTIKDVDPASLTLSTSQAGTPGNTGQTGSSVATVKNANGDELSGHLVRFELYQHGTSVDLFFAPFDTTQLDLGTLVAGTPTCPSLGCAAFANTGSGFAAGGATATETPGQAKMTWTDIDTSPYIGDPLYAETTTLDTVVACLADDGTGVAASPTCGMAIVAGLPDASGLSLPGNVNEVSFAYYTPN